MGWVGVVASGPVLAGLEVLGPECVGCSPVGQGVIELVAHGSAPSLWGAVTCGFVSITGVVGGGHAVRDLHSMRVAATSTGSYRFARSRPFRRG